MDIQDIFPAKNHLIVKPIEDDEEVTKDGFILPKNFHQKPMKAKVVSVSDEEYDSSLNIKIGDMVLLPKRGATQIKDGIDIYHLCHINDIIGVI